MKTKSKLKNKQRKTYKKSRSFSNKSRSRSNQYRKLRRKMKGGAPWRLTVDSYTELQKYLDNNKSWITPNTRIWVVKNTDNQALYESNSKDILESLYDHGITPQNINEYSFNIL